MKRRMLMIPMVVAALLVVCVDHECGAEDPGILRSTAKTTPVLVLEGSPHDRGLRHGRMLKDQIHKIVRLWKEHISSQYGMSADSFIDQFMEKTNYVSAIEKHTPGLLQEIKGIAEGAEIDFNTMFVFQFFDEIGAQGEAISVTRCSCLGFSKGDGEPSIVAQNNDLEILRGGFQIVLHIKHDETGLEALVHSNAGCIGWNGINNRSVGICVNTVSQLSNCTDGLPVNCIIRGVLMQPTEAEAVQFVRRIKHASGANYVIGGLEKVYSFECSASRGAVRYRPDGQDVVVWHTNHPLVNDDYNENYKNRLKNQATNSPLSNSEVRLQCLKRRTSNHEGAARLALINAMSQIS